MAEKFDIERKIIDAFKLFQGVRSHDEDKRILEKMLEICKQEMILFLSENLNTKQTKEFEKDAKKEGAEKALAKWIREIPMGRFRLEERLKYTVDTVLTKTIWQKTQKQ